MRAKNYCKLLQTLIFVLAIRPPCDNSWKLTVLSHSKEVSSAVKHVLTVYSLPLNASIQTLPFPHD
jgi:hypothetical protein